MQVPAVRRRVRRRQREAVELGIGPTPVLQLVADDRRGQAVVDAFEQEPGWRLDAVPRGPGHVLTVYPEDGALVDAVLSIDVRENNIGDVRWSPGDLTPAQQDELLRRVERALKTARAVKLDEILPSPLQGRIEEIRRRADDLGIDPAVLAGRESQGVMATALAYLAERRDMVRDLIQWLQETYYDHPAVEVLAEWRYGSGPGESFTQKLWSAVFQESNTATVTAREDGLRTSCEAPFTTHDGKQAVLLRRALASAGTVGSSMILVDASSCS